MDLFFPRVKSRDPFIQAVGGLAETAILETFAECAAFAQAERERQRKAMESKYPGYTEELNRQRRRLGLTPV